MVWRLGTQMRSLDYNLEHENRSGRQQRESGIRLTIAGRRVPPDFAGWESLTQQLKNLNVAALEPIKLFIIKRPATESLVAVVSR